MYNIITANLKRNTTASYIQIINFAAITYRKLDSKIYLTKNKWKIYLLWVESEAIHRWL